MAVSSPLSSRHRLLLAITTAVLWWSAQLHSGLFALGWVALIPFFFSLQGLDARARWKAGWRGGWICYALLNWWIIPTVTRAAPTIGLPNIIGLFLGLLAVTLIALIHGSFVSVVALAWNTRAPLFRRAPWALPIWIAALWAALDALRCETQLAHGWGALAFTQWRDTALLQSAAFVGQHGLTALCVWFAASLALWLQRGASSGSAALWRAPLAAWVLLHLAGAWHLRQIDAQQAPKNGQGLHVLLVQTNIPSLGKTFSASGESALEQALRLTLERVSLKRARNERFDLIVWPETTIFAGRLPAPGATGSAAYVGASLGMAQVLRLAHDLGTPILCGADATINSPDEALGGARDRGRNGARNGRGDLVNTALLVEADGRVQNQAKMRLVPFGERASYGEWLPFLRRLSPDPELTPATSTQPLVLHRTTGDVPIGTIICFESGFPYPARRVVKNGARALFVLTNDEWFSGSDAPWEHAAMLAVRAAENGVATAQAANGGLSAAVDPEGRFVIKGRYGVAESESFWLPLSG